MNYLKSFFFSKKDLLKIIIVVIPVIIGILLYLTYRVETLKISKWLKYVGLESFLDFLRTDSFLQNLVIPDWIIYNLPFTLWVFSFTYLILTIWKFQISSKNILWICIIPIIAIFSEVSQAFGLIKGTFDFKDLIMIIVSSLFPFIIIIFIKLKPNNYEKKSIS